MELVQEKDNGLPSVCIGGGEAFAKELDGGFHKASYPWKSLRGVYYDILDLAISATFYFCCIYS